MRCIWIFISVAANIFSHSAPSPKETVMGGPRGTNIHMYVTYVNVAVHVIANVFAYLFVYVFACVYLHVHVHACVYIYIYTHVYTDDIMQHYA